MNLLLLEAGELSADGSVRLAGDDRRAGHLRRVLAVAPGRSLHVGVLDGGVGEALVLALDDDGAVHLRCRIDQPAPAPAADRLLLAVPRPKVLLRCAEQAAALGFGHLHLLRTWRVDKSHLGARALRLDAVRQRMRLGLEQARRTRLPQVHVHPLFKPFVEDRLPALAAPCLALVAHPDAEVDVAELAPGQPRPRLLAIGPERGFTAYEVQALRAAGCTPVRAGPHPLQVEAALLFLCGALHARR